MHDKTKTQMWLAEPLPKQVANRVERMAALDDVEHVAVMPDVHLANEYCVGTAVATHSHILPHAIGSDIGCGMTAIRVHESADRLTRKNAQRIFELLHQFVPSNRLRRESIPANLPKELTDHSLSDARLSKRATRDGLVQLGTLGRGNHFLEFQSSVDGDLWIMVHTGSRAMGQAITGHHLRKATANGGLSYFEADSEDGRNYLNDLAWASKYAKQNRAAIARMVAEILQAMWSADVDENSLIESDHNHVRREQHEDRWFWVHRKGAQSAAADEMGVIPGSMGTASYHVEGRGCALSLHSSSHGAGRNGSRRDARARISVKKLQREMGGVYFDERKSEAIRDEAPSAYKDIRKVMRAQRDLVKIVRELQPVLSYKGV